MANLGNIQIDLFNIERLLKVTCTVASCRFNLLNADYDGDKAAICNLKHIVISYDAKCTQYEKLVIADEDNDDA